MSERSATGTTTAPESNTGLAMIVGELKAEQRHHVEGTADALDEIRASQAEETAARESALADLNEILAGLRDVVQQVVDTVESLATTKKRTTRTTVGAETTIPPVRKRGENNGDYNNRLAAWAKDNDANDPPKPKGTEFKDAYDKRVQAWANANVSV